MLKRVLFNAGWLGVLQLVQYLVPLVTVPFLTRAFGVQLYGLIATITAYAGYVSLLIGYGFGFVGPREVAKASEDVAQISRYVSAAFAVQCFLAVIGSCAFFAAVPMIDVLKLNFAIAAYLLTQTVLSGLSLTWVFVGLERMKPLVIPQMVLRVATAVFVVLVVRSKADLNAYLFMTTFVSLANLVFNIYLLNKMGISVFSFNLKAVLQAFHSSSPLFVSNVFISAYTTSNVIIVYHLVGEAGAGAYALADRIRQMVMSVYGPVSQSLYPFICRMSTAATSELAESESVKAIFFRVILAGAAALSLALYLSSDIVVSLLGGSAFTSAASILRWLAFTPLVIASSNILGVQTMLPRHMEKQFSVILCVAAVLGLTSCYYMSGAFGSKGAAIANLSVEIFVTLCFALFLWLRGVSVVGLFLPPATSSGRL